MMCWESLVDPEQASKKRKTHAQDAETNDKADDMDDKTHTKCTANTGNQLNITVDDLKLGADDDSSMLTTQETLAKNLVYITNKSIWLWFRVVVPSDMFSSECQADAGQVWRYEEIGHSDNTK